MKKVIWSVLLVLVLLVGLGVGFSTTVSAAGPTTAAIWSPGAVYSMTNDTLGNAVVMFNRAFDGTLTKAGSFPTEGLGAVPTTPDPLGSQGSLVLTPDGKWLLAVNAGSNDITVFRVKPGGLDFVEKVSSGGVMPVSLTVSWNRVYVLNAGGSPNITGFNLNYWGDLDPITGSTRSLGSGSYAQVGFNPSGNWLVVTDKAGSRILVFSVGYSGKPGASPAISPSNGNTPFGFTFDAGGHLLVVEVYQLTPTTFNGAVSSYAVMPNGMLKVINGSVHNGQAAACWIQVTQCGNLYTTNPGSGTISSYKDMVLSGNISLKNATAASGIAALDEGITENGQFLYALNPAMGGIDMFRIAPDGSLTLLGIASPGTFTGGAQGIAVK